MDSKLKISSEASLKPSSSVMNGHPRNTTPEQQFLPFDPRNVGFSADNEQSFPELSPPMDTFPRRFHPLEQEVKNIDKLQANPLENYPGLEWDPRAMLNNLSFLEQKIRQVQEIVRSMINQEDQYSNQANELAAQQQLVTADLTCIIIQLISTAGTLLPNMKSSLLSASSAMRQPAANIIPSPTSLPADNNSQQNNVLPAEIAKTSEYDEIFKSYRSCDGEGDELLKCLNSSGGEGSDSFHMEDFEGKDYDDGMDRENLPPGSYEVLQLEKEEILAPHTHFCSICGKGFKRDANLRMHMRGHGDEYKTPAALAKPLKEASSEPVPIKRYSCPFVGCKRNKVHKKFQPLKTILCVKNHYKRTHCDKSYTCSRCNTKKFSVIADLKTHEKHCGRDKWLCSCGTTFSRKDKLFGHVALFQGHTPVLLTDDVNVSGTPDQAQGNQMVNGLLGNMDFSFGGSTSMDIRNLDNKAVDDARGCFSPLNFDSSNFGGLDDFSGTAFDMSENPFSFLPTGSCSFMQRNGEN